MSDERWKVPRAEIEFHQRVIDDSCDEFLIGLGAWQRDAAQQFLGIEPQPPTAPNDDAVAF
jgi:hypothetical protein